MGMIYKRGNVWWIKYYKNGEPLRESSGSTKKMVAKKLLDRREGEIAIGKIPGIKFEKVKFDELAEEFLRDYRINQKKSLVRAERSVNHLSEFFEGYRAAGITTPVINQYIELRIDEGAANATINRELSALKRMFNLGAKQTPPKVDRVPYIPMLKENNVRKDFFEHSQYLALKDALPSYLKPFVTFAYNVGWRDTEIAGLTWNQVDLDQGTVRLEVGDTKNNEGRTIYLDQELKILFRMQWEKRKRSGKIIPYVFPNKLGTGPIKDFRYSWNNACRKAGLGYGYKFNKKYVEKWKDELPAGPILHDFRRTAVRNMVRAGIPERVAMMISGHKTRSVFDRYNIVSDSDLRLAAKLHESYLQSATGTISGTIRNLDIKKGDAENG
jgi:integrase